MARIRSLTPELPHASGSPKIPNKQTNHQKYKERNAFITVWHTAHDQSLWRGWQGVRRPEVYTTALALSHGQRATLITTRKGFLRIHEAPSKYSGWSCCPGNRLPLLRLYQVIMLIMQIRFHHLPTSSGGHVRVYLYHLHTRSQH